ncbi:phosphotransferase family protein [Barrientosiimonas marina]|uniref:Phosphotransferase n=1 Tax=Lentibacillus kimchii TaxID=1542911 RepID=A0ABW2UWU7_9BACI
MNWFQKAVGKEWDITPAGGLTGDAYIAAKDDRRLFLKRNSSPFLAVLSAEDIVPKLVFTKRMENGDVITGQEWLSGRELRSEEMQQYRVADLLRKIHESSELLYMLMRLGKQPVTPDERFQAITDQLEEDGLVSAHLEIQQTLKHLWLLLPATRGQQYAVCHCDLHHNNLILTTSSQLYLVDWDNAMIADPAMDFGFILKWYVPEEDWEAWLTRYGVNSSPQLFERIYWYVLLDVLQYVTWHWQRRDMEKIQNRLADLRSLNDHISHTILSWSDR